VKSVANPFFDFSIELAALDQSQVTILSVTPIRSSFHETALLKNIYNVYGHSADKTPTKRAFLENLLLKMVPEANKLKFS
jgi:hypothetical protein